MKASNCTLSDIFAAAKSDGDLHKSLSFVQVEYGFTELEGCWHGFSDASDAYEVVFKSKKHVANDFAIALTDFYGPE
jgi:hypothetical protein